MLRKWCTNNVELQKLIDLKEDGEILHKIMQTNPLSPAFNLA